MRRSRGFTGIEFLIVLVLIGILLAIFIPNFVAMRTRAKEAAVKSDCHVLQLAVEDWAVNNDGQYPTSLDQRGVHGRSVIEGLRSMRQSGDAMPFVNHFTGLRTEPSGGNTRGCVLYFNGRGISYGIIGLGANGQEIVTLTNGTP